MIRAECSSRIFEGLDSYYVRGLTSMRIACLNRAGETRTYKPRLVFVVLISSTGISQHTYIYPLSTLYNYVLFQHTGYRHLN